jgi:ADP-heptose:LPS heptosyltransferase
MHWSAPKWPPIFVAMLGALFTRVRQFSRLRRRQRQVAQFSQTDQAALASQAAPDPGRVLVVRNDSIGDYLLYRPWLRLLAQQVRGRGQRLTLAANALWAPLARAWDADLFDELLVVEFGQFQKDLGYRTEMLRTLGTGGYGEVVYPLHVREPAVENFIRFMQAPIRVASQGEHRTDAWFGLLDQGYTTVLPTTQDTLFEYDRNGEFFTNWLAMQALPAPADLRPPLHLPVSATDAARFHPLGAPPAIVLFPGASARQKQWPAAHFAALALGLPASTSATAGSIAWC